MPPFLIQRKRIQISASTCTSVFESFSTVHISYEKTIRFRPPRTKWLSSSWRRHVFENLRFRRFRPSTLVRKASVFESLHLERRFRKPPFSWVKVSVFHRISVDDPRKRIQKFQTKTGLVWTRPKGSRFTRRGQSETCNNGRIKWKKDFKKRIQKIKQMPGELRFFPQ